MIEGGGGRVQTAHVSDVVRDNKLMIVGVTLLARPASTLALICYEPLTPRERGGGSLGMDQNG